MAVNGNVNRKGIGIKRILVVFLFALFIVGAGAKVPDSAEDITPLSVGETAPGITLQNDRGEEFDLGASIEKTPAILVFFRGRW